jgi:dTDP-4-dehydrorhamnose 3,5-epimerase
VPERFAHGYITLEDNTDTSYLVGEYYTPGAESGLMYDDPRLALRWPIPVKTVSEKDMRWELLDDFEDDLIRRMAIREEVKA